jgi:hypothetical protein
MENTKFCYNCKENIPQSNFFKNKKKKDGLADACKPCAKNLNKKYYDNNKERVLKKNKEYRIDNIKKINIQRKEYRNRPEIKEHCKEKNKEYLPIKKEKIKEKRKNDLNFRLSEVLRSKIHKVLKNINTSYEEILGCNKDFLKKWLEYRFDSDMTWENYGKYWDIDHIIPISKFDFSNDTHIKICFHWTNL